VHNIRLKIELKLKLKSTVLFTKHKLKKLEENEKY